MVRVKSGENSDRLFPSAKDFELCIKSMPNTRSRLAARIMARSSPRADFCLGLKRKHFFIPDSADVHIAFVKIRESKDTSDGEGDGQNRISWVPARLYDRVQEYCDHRGIGPDDEIFDIEYDTIRRDFIEAGKNMIARTGDEIWLDFRPHDCRRFYANHMIRRLNIDKDLVMEMGGWGSEAALRPYLLHSQPRSIQDRLERQGVLNRDVPDPRLAPEKERLHKRIELLQQVVEDLARKLQGEDVNLSETTAQTIDDITLGQINEIKEDHFVDVGEDEEMSNKTDSESSNKATETRNASLSMFREGDDGVPSSLPGFGWVQSCAWTVSTLGKRLRKEWDEALMGSGELPSRRKMARSMPILISVLLMMGLVMAKNGIYIDPVAGQVSLPEAQAATLLAGSTIGIAGTLYSDYCSRIRNESTDYVIRATVGSTLR